MCLGTSHLQMVSAFVYGMGCSVYFVWSGNIFLLPLPENMCDLQQFANAIKTNVIWWK